MRPSTLLAILTDIHLWVPVTILIFGVCLLFYLR
jgi:hypothetical protein